MIPEWQLQTAGIVYWNDGSFCMLFVSEEVLPAMKIATLSFAWWALPIFLLGRKATEQYKQQRKTLAEVSCSTQDPS